MRQTPKATRPLLGPAHRLTCAAILCAIVAQTTNAQSIACASDEFESAASLADWSRVEFTEGWNASHLESLSIHAGALTMEPHTSVWYENYRGAMLYKVIEGDFAVTTTVTATGRDGLSIPRSQFSLAGIMVRQPREITPATWAPGGENYVFLSTGYASGPSAWTYEVKTTTNSNSIFHLSPATGPTSTLQIVRLGSAIIALLRPDGGSWTVHARYHRSDLGNSVQVGLVSYTDWTKCQPFSPFDHNANTLAPPLAIPDPSPAQAFDPDLRATYEYVRFAIPALPPELAGVDLTNQALVSDAQLLAFLGATLDLPAPPCCPADYNADGLADILDFLDFVDDFSACDGSPGPCGTTGNADLNNDGVVDVLDFLDFLDAFSNGC